jgi:hypothetical protein
VSFAPVETTPPREPALREARRLASGRLASRRLASRRGLLGGACGRMSGASSGRGQGACGRMSGGCAVAHSGAQGGERSLIRSQDWLVGHAVACSVTVLGRPRGTRSRVRGVCGRTFRRLELVGACGRMSGTSSGRGRRGMRSHVRRGCAVAHSFLRLNGGACGRMSGGARLIPP